MAGVVLMGMLGYFLLPVSALPPVDFPTIQVTGQFPGGSPDVMASSVTTPLERQFGQISGLSMMTSVSSFGNSAITLQFNLSLSIDIAEQEVQQSINASGTFLPSDLPVPPIYAKTNPADTPILTLALTSKTEALSKVEDLADRVEVLPDRLLLYTEDGEETLVKVHERGLAPAAVLVRRSTLEDVFLRLTGRTLVD